MTDRRPLVFVPGTPNLWRAIPDGDRLLLPDGAIAGQPMNGLAQTGSSPWDQRYLLGYDMNVTLTTATLVANTLYALEFVAQASTIDKLGCEITTGVAGNFRVGIWTPTSRTNKYPSALVVDTGSLSSGSTGMIEAPISQALIYGRRYIAGVVADVAMVHRAPAASGMTNHMGYPPTGGTLSYWGCTVAFTYGALGTFPSGAALQTGVPRPGIFTRYSA